MNYRLYSKMHESFTMPYALCLEKAMAPHSSTLAWKIPWMEEPARLQSMGLLRVGHDWATSLSFFTFMHWRRKWQPTPVLLPGESQGWGSLVGCVYEVAQSRTRLKRLNIIFWFWLFISRFPFAGGYRLPGHPFFFSISVWISKSQLNANF